MARGWKSTVEIATPDVVFVGCGRQRRAFFQQLDRSLAEPAMCICDQTPLIDCPIDKHRIAAREREMRAE